MILLVVIEMYLQANRHPCLGDCLGDFSPPLSMQRITYFLESQASPG